MKTLIIVTIIIGIILGVFIANNTDMWKEKNSNKFWDYKVDKIVVYDGCEYLLGRIYSNYGYFFTHKGNCKNH